jgi:hypothetical protein
MMIYLACTPIGGASSTLGDPDKLTEVRLIGLDELDVLLPVCSLLSGSTSITS